MGVILLAMLVETLVQHKSCLPWSGGVDMHTHAHVCVFHVQDHFFLFASGGFVISKAAGNT